MVDTSEHENALQEVKDFLTKKKVTAHWKAVLDTPCSSNSKIDQLDGVIDSARRLIEDVVSDITQLNDNKELHTYMALAALSSPTPSHYLSVYHAIVRSIKAQLSWFQDCVKQEIALTTDLEGAYEHEKYSAVMKKARQTLALIHLSVIIPDELKSPAFLPDFHGKPAHDEDECLPRLDEVIGRISKRLSFIRDHSQALRSRENREKGSRNPSADDDNLDPILDAFRVLITLVKFHSIAHGPSASTKILDKLQPLEKLVARRSESD